MLMFNTPEAQRTLIITAIGVALLGFAAYLYYRKTQRGGGDLGSKGKRKVGSLLRSVAGIRGFKVLDNVTLPSAAGSGSVTIDHLMVGIFGILLVTDLTLEGDYYGTLEEANWSCTTKGDPDSSVAAKRIGTVPNPLRHSESFQEAARRILSKEGIYNMKMESMAVASSAGAFFYITGGKGRVTPINKLRSQLQATRFDTDNGVDIGKITAIFSQANMNR